MEEALAAFNMGRVEPNGVKLAVASGQEGTSIEFWHYDVSENADGAQAGKRFVVVGIYYYKCSRDLGVEKRNVMENAKFWISREDLFVNIGREEAGEGDVFKTTDRLEEFTNAPYLISINSYEAVYFGAIRVLSARFKDRSLAGYFISEINRSCGSKFRARHCPG